MPRIAVDVTPLLPGGINGGAKPMVVALLQELPRLMADDEFTLWTADHSHDELAFLDRPNLKRVCIRFGGPGKSEKQLGVKRFAKKGWDIAKRWLPQGIQYRLRALYYRNRSSPLSSIPHVHQKDQGMDFLFCPFGAPTYYNPGTPILSIVYDLQFLDYPGFFTEQERFYRQLHFDQVCQRADHVATISEFTRQSVLRNSSLSPEQVTTIHIGFVHDYSIATDPLETQKVLERLRLKPKRYLFYPANFWAHKNHGVLLQAFQLFRQKHPESDLKIVLTGALDDRREMLDTEAKRMGLDHHIITPGFLPDQEIGILYRYAKGLVFPSLYEGFGIPLLEAMQAGIPVACSNVTSLPEIGDDAVLYFNPRDASEVSQSIEALEFNDELRNELIRKGYERLRFFGDARVMAQNYANLIRRIISSKKKIYAYGLHGLTEDRWFQESAYLSFPASSQERFLEFSIQVPTWMPNGQALTIARAGVQLASYRCDRGGRLAASLALPFSSDMLEMRFSTAYVPADLGIANDNRPLSALCESLRIKAPDDTLLFTPFRVDPNR